MPCVYESIQRYNKPQNGAPEFRAAYLPLLHAHSSLLSLRLSPNVRTISLNSRNIKALASLQLPLRGSSITTLTFITGFLLSEREAECNIMYTENPDFRRFSGELEHVYALWRNEGTTPACAHLCGDLLVKDMSPRLCGSLCRGLLPCIWSVYGQPWMHACMVHRLIVVVGVACK